MSDAPEKIWIDTTGNKEKGPNWPTKPVWAATEYTRTDTIPSAAYVAGLEAALREISDRHIPDQPASYGGDELEWAVRQHVDLRRIARAALASRPASHDVRVVTVEQLENIEQELSNRVADFPRYTCSDIDAAIRSVGPLVKQAYSMEDNEFAQEFWGACSSLPSDLDDLRNANSQLRESLLEALKSRKDMAEEIRAIIGGQP